MSDESVEDLLARCNSLIDELLRECGAFVAEHYEPAEGDDWEDGTSADPEHVGQLALKHVLGLEDTMDRLDAQLQILGTMQDLSKVDVTRIVEPEDIRRAVRVQNARESISVIAYLATSRWAEEERLYGEVQTRKRKPHAREEWAVMVLTDGRFGGPDASAYAIVSNYLWNVEDGIEDVTGSFHDYRDRDVFEGE